MSICVKTSVLANTVLESRSGASVKGWSLIFKEWDWWHWNNSDYWNRIKRHLSRNPGFWINRDVRFNRSRVDSGMYNFKYSRSNCEVLSGLRATGGRSVDLRKPQEVCRSKRGLRRGAGDLHSPDREKARKRGGAAIYIKFCLCKFSAAIGGVSLLVRTLGTQRQSWRRQRKKKWSSLQGWFLFF